jgi:hypothetical protein
LTFRQQQFEEGGVLEFFPRPNEYFLAACNEHVNALFNKIDYSFPANIPEWEITCSHGSIYGDTRNNCQKWLASYGSTSCFSKTTLKGNGRATIDFGNCWHNSVVKVFLDENEIASAGGSEENIVKEFDFTDGSELKLTEEQFGIIRFNSFEVLNCVSTGMINQVQPLN